ncbi:MAG: PEP-CTERM sorting domain-containing protein [Oscillatoriales cyanobacterium SM2_2_1]|nr:PEP-CTERM sorting domain-containing protein [Oscillatoriales cyanobacterium SM2_2_1]
MQKAWSFVAVGITTLFGVSAAQASSLVNLSITGSAPNDYRVFDISGTTVNVVPATLGNAEKVLDGNAANPTGNVELAASSEQFGFDFSKNTALTGTIAGKSLTLSSLTAADWQIIGNQWFDDLLTAYLVLPDFLIPNLAEIKIELRSRLLTEITQRRFSDPNISYVYQDPNNTLRIGLAGFLDARPILTQGLNLSDRLFVGTLLPRPVQISELVKYTYGDKTGYLYSFFATPSGLVAGDDGVSFTGNYEVTIPGHPTRAVPGPGVLAGVAASMGLGALQMSRRKKGAEPNAVL